jgi:SsrA-binding protein
MEHKKTHPEKKVVVTNRKVFHDYDILEKYEAGIALAGHEVKSLRESQGSIQDSYCKIDNGEISIYNFHISPYDKAGSWSSGNPKRIRKLLLHKREIYRIFGRMTQRNLALVPSEVYFNRAGLVKVTLCLVKKRTGPDKREAIRQKDLEREMRSMGKRTMTRRELGQ